MMTPDWILSSVAKLISGRFKSNEFADSSHLKIKPVGIFTKPEEPAHRVEMTQLKDAQNESSESFLVGNE